MISADMANEQLVKEMETLRQHAAELEEFKAEYQRGIKALLQVEEEERRSIAREIHDDLSQPLTAFKINLSWLRRRIPKGEGLLLEKLEQMLDLTGSITRAAKIISVELRPGVLDDLGLTAAIEWQAGYFREQTGIECELDVEPADTTPDGEIATAIFRILQKILKSISEQASATRVRISLKRRANKIRLKVIDNGGRTTEEQILDRDSLGLMEISERAYLFGGEVKIKGNPDRGTTVTVNIPLDHKGGSLW
jgi:signal transduction histidine kinase